MEVQRMSTFTSIVQRGDPLSDDIAKSHRPPDHVYDRNVVAGAHRDAREHLAGNTRTPDADDHDALRDGY